MEKADGRNEPPTTCIVQFQNKIVLINQRRSAIQSLTHFCQLDVEKIRQKMKTMKPWKNIFRRIRHVYKNMEYILSFSNGVCSFEESIFF